MTDYLAKFKSARWPQVESASAMDFIAIPSQSRYGYAILKIAANQAKAMK